MELLRKHGRKPFSGFIKNPAQRDENRTYQFEHFHKGVNAARFDRFLAGCNHWIYSDNFTKSTERLRLGRFRKIVGGS
jgi:hypothetical protein